MPEDLTDCISDKLRDYQLDTLDDRSLLTVVMSINRTTFDSYKNNFATSGKYAQTLHWSRRL